MARLTDVPFSLRTLALLSLSLIACGGDETTDEGDEDVRSDAGRDDTGTPADGSTTADTTPEPPREEVYVVWSEAPVQGATGELSRLYIADEDCRLDKTDLCEAGSCEPVEIESPNPEDGLCERGCLLTDDLAYIVFVDPNAANTLRYAPLGDDFQLAAESTIIATDVYGFSVGGGRVAYETVDSISVFDLASGQVSPIAQLPGTGGATMSPDGEKVFVKRVNNATGTIMDLLQYNADGTGETLLFTFTDADVTGSLLSGSEAIAISPDGQTLAIATNYRLQANVCSSNADCTAPGFECPVGGVSSRCNAQQQAIQFINLGAADRLGQACGSDSECGARHFCDLSAPDDSGQGVCLPSRAILGFSGQNRCSVLRIGEYDSVLQGMSWVDNNRVMALAANSCGGQNIEVTDLIRVSADSGVVEPLLENPGQPFGGCIDSVEQCYEADACTIEYSGISVSPEGAWVGLLGDSYTAAGNPEVWLYDVRRDEKYPLTRTLATDARHVQVLRRTE